jgi:PST family polysaccharide transporter
MTTASFRFKRSFLTAAALAFGFALTLPARAAAGPFLSNSEVQALTGKSIAEWGAEWWQWAFQNPAVLVDKTGKSGPLGDVSPNVFFAEGSGGRPVNLKYTVPGDKYILVPVINSIVFLTIGLVGQYIAFRRFDLSLRLPSLKKIRQEMKAGWDVFISIVAINAYTNTRIFAVGLFTNNTLTGFYSIAERIANVAQTFPLLSFSQAIFPRLTKIYHKNKALAFKIMQQVQLITVLLSLICLPLILMFAPLLVRLICGGDYPETVLSLRLLLVGVFFVSANAFRVQFLLVCGKTYEYSKIHVTMAMLGLPLLIALIYCFSYVGAALATAIIEAGIFTLTYVRVKKLRFP